MAEAHRILIGDVPCHVEDRGGPLIVGLTFRVGASDETLPKRGLTHLVEHLALHEAAVARLSMNGSVESTLTHFVVRGTPDEIKRFFAFVCDSLEELPLARLEAEARVLRTEAASSPGSIYTSLLANRFGASDYGLAAFPEFGLVQPTGDEVQEWCKQWFTADNAVMWATGEVPVDLEINLPRGKRHSPREPEPLPFSLPAWYRDSTNVVGLSYVINRCDASHLAVQLLGRRVHDRLRMNQGHSYQVVGFLETWTTNHMHGIIAADTLVDHATEVCTGLLAEVERLAGARPPAEEIAQLVAEADRAWSDPEAAGPSASQRASNELVGRRVRTDDEVLDALRAVTGDEVQHAADAIFASALLQVPNTVEVPNEQFTAIPPGSEHLVSGHSFRRSQTVDSASRAQRLVIGEEGVSFVISPEVRITVRQRDLAAIQTWTDDARTWWGRDGFRVFVHPKEWTDGAIAIDLLDEEAATDLTVPMHEDAGSQYLEVVERLKQAAPRSLAQRIRRR